MMAMKFFQPSLRLRRELEFDIWREANLVESYGTSKEGLALAAARRGFDVCTLGKHLRHSFIDTLADKIPGIDYRTLELLYQDTLRKFRALGLRNLNEPIDLNDLRNALRRNQVPIVLTDTMLFREKESLPHWIVLTGYSKGWWSVNNPLAKSSGTRVKESELRDHLGFQGVRCALLVLGLRRRKRVGSDSLGLI